jgi:hypothetical protein
MGKYYRITVMGQQYQKAQRGANKQCDATCDQKKPPFLSHLFHPDLCNKKPGYPRLGTAYSIFSINYPK